MRGIGGLILAAGGSTRLGEPKQLITLHGETLVHAAVRAAQEGGCDPVCVVTGHAKDKVEAAVAGLEPLVSYNAEWRRGIGRSIRLGLESLNAASAVVILACDQPAVDSRLVRALMEQHRQSGRAIVASCYAGTRGIPALFDASCFDELRALPDDSGAKAVILADPGRVAVVPFDAGAFDLDTPADLQAWAGASASRRVPQGPNPPPTHIRNRPDRR